MESQRVGYDLATKQQTKPKKNIKQRQTHLGLQFIVTEFKPVSFIYLFHFPEELNMKLYVETKNK